MKNKYPRIKPHFSIIAHSVNQIELRSGIWNHVGFTIEDETDSGNLYRFITLLDGTRSLSEIVKILQMSRSDAEAIMDHLQQLSVLEDNASSAFDYYADIYASAFKNHQRNQKEIDNIDIAILSNLDLGSTIQKNLLENTPLKKIKIVEDKKIFNILEASDEAWLHNGLQFEVVLQNFTSLQNNFVILAFDYVSPVFAKRFNRIAAALNIHWLHATIDGPFIFIGPLFEVPRTACYECFETRVSMNLREFNAYQKYKKAIVNNQIIRQAQFPMTPLLHNLMISHLMMEVMNYALTGCGFLKNKVMSIYLPTMEIMFNEFMKLSACQNCSAQVHRDDHQLYFDIQRILRETA